MIWVTVYRPTNRAVEDVANEIKTRTKQLSRFSEVNAQYRQMRNAINEITSASRAAVSRLPDQHNAEQWLGKASKAAQLSGLVVRSVKIAGNRGGESWGVLPINMEVSGSFSALYELIQRFERMERLVPIQRLDIRRTDDANVDVTMIVHLLFDEAGSEQ
jgi:Tfp pilus assembly protein PilO